jgi:hypothetical protein
MINLIKIKLFCFPLLQWMERDMFHMVFQIKFETNHAFILSLIWKWSFHAR